jgi:lycopene beta-cyclase
MHLSHKYDYIVTGGGCAGLSFIMQVLQTPDLQNKRILLIEKEAKNTNDRTWCFWEKGEGVFEKIVYRNWDRAWFHANAYSSLKSLTPYKYKMIRGIDFYSHCHEIIKNSPRVDHIIEEVTALENIGDGVLVKTKITEYQCQYVFNSILFKEPSIKPGYFYLLQHFKGWIIETEVPSFNPSEATLMDFRVSQQEGTTFFYVMPFSETKALVEFTLFTPSLLDDAVYEESLKNYIEEKLGIKNYKVSEKEFGVIPMTDHDFPEGDGRIVHLGTAGGKTKPSSGYTFTFIQKHVNELVLRLQNEGNPIVKSSNIKKRFLWYDRVLLHILFHRKVEGARIFHLLFKKNSIKRLFSFLDNESTINQELILLNTLPQWPFMKAGWKELFK